MRSRWKVRLSSHLFLRDEPDDYPCPRLVHDRIKVRSEVGKRLYWRLQRVTGPDTSIATGSPVLNLCRRSINICASKYVPYIVPSSFPVMSNVTDRLGHPGSQWVYWFECKCGFPLDRLEMLACVHNVQW